MMKSSIERLAELHKSFREQGIVSYCDPEWSEYLKLVESGMGTAEASKKALKWEAK